jgi:hypothetical protein
MAKENDDDGGNASDNDEDDAEYPSDNDDLLGNPVFSPQAIVTSLTDEPPLETPDVAAKRRELELCYSAVAFIDSLVKALPTVEGLLFSKTSSDVTEALHFFVCATRFNVPGSGRAGKLNDCFVCYTLIA